MEFSLLLVANRQGLAGNAFAWRDIPGAERDGNIEHYPQSGRRFSEDGATTKPTASNPISRSGPMLSSTIWLTINGQRQIFNHMVEYQDPLDAVFHALADPTRRAMLRSLAAEPRKVGELAHPFAISLAAASKHIKVLERAGLVERRVEGRTHTCRLNPRPLHAGLEWMRFYEKLWNQRLDTLDALLIADAIANPQGS
ncbi:ArsR/SmtB family transcription factor [Labrys sp. WJW]|uniref:ArsR/SmtB family transcription factor n=2 Tax=Labrys TaxID=204476 RepID=UPI0035294DDE